MMVDESAHRVMKTCDVFAAVFLLVGSLHSGLIGFFGFDLIGSVCGSMGLLSRLIYSLIGLSGLYLVFQVKAITRWWECTWVWKAFETPTV